MSRDIQGNLFICIEAGLADNVLHYSISLQLPPPSHSRNLTKNLNRIQARKMQNLLAQPCLNPMSMKSERETFGPKVMRREQVEICNIMPAA